MTSLVTRLAAASVLAIGFATAASAAPIVTNGSFESGLAGWTTNGGGTTPGIGITVLTTGGVNTTGYGDNVPNYDGTHAAFFVDDNANENLFQNVSLVGGQQYSLSFALFATTSGSSNPFSFQLQDAIGANILSTLTNGVGTNVPVGVWTAYSYTFVVPTTTTYLLNFNFKSGSTPAKDVLLDAVAINAVPEPASWALMLLGFGGLGLSMRRRRTEVQFA